MNSLILLFMLVIWSAKYSVGDDDYKISKLKNPMGLYFDKLGKKVKLQREEIRVTFGTDLQHYFERENEIKEFYLQAREYCSKYVGEEKMRATETRFNKSSTEFKNAFGIVETNEHNKHRTKRGIFNFIGSIFRSMFGTMDNNDREDINKKLKYLTNLQNDTLYVVKENHNIMIKQFKLIQGSFEEARKILINVNEQVKARVNTSSCQSMISTLDDYITDYKMDTLNLVTAMKFAQAGQFHPKLLNKYELVENIKSAVTSSSAELPMDINLENLQNLISICNVNIFIYSNGLAFVLDIPMLYTNNFNLYKMIPFPTIFDEKTNAYSYVKLKDSYSYIAISEDEEEYFFLTQTKLSHCKIGLKEYICPNVNKVHLIGDNMSVKNCEVKMLTTNTFDPYICNTVLSNQTDIFWKKLQRENIWLSMAPKKEEMHLSCPSNVYKEIVGANVLNISSNCRVETDTTLLLPLYKTKNTFDFDFNTKNVNTLHNTTLLTNSEYSDAFMEIKNNILKIKDFENIIKQGNVELKEVILNSKYDEAADKIKNIIKTYCWYYYQQYLGMFAIVVNIGIIIIFEICMLCCRKPNSKRTQERMQVIYS